MITLKRQYTKECLLKYIDDVKRKYRFAQDGYEFHFDDEIQPFLLEADALASFIESLPTDRYFNDSTRLKLSRQITELAMACHKKELKPRLYNEKIKFINMWFNYFINKEII